MSLYRAAIDRFESGRLWIVASTREIFVIAPTIIEAESIANHGLPDDQKAYVVACEAPPEDRPGSLRVERPSSPT